MNINYINHIIQEIISSENKFLSSLDIWTEIAKKITNPQISPVLTAYDTISKNNKFSDANDYTQLLNEKKVDAAIQKISKEINESLDYKKDSFTTSNSRQPHSKKIFYIKIKKCNF